MALFNRQPKLSDAQNASIARDHWRADVYDLDGKPDEAQLLRQLSFAKQAFGEAKAAEFKIWRIGTEHSDEYKEATDSYYQLRTFWRRMRDVFPPDPASAATIMSAAWQEPSDEELLK